MRHASVFLPLSAAFLAAGCGAEPARVPAPAHPGHVGAAVCAECHPAEHAKWRDSDHFRAMAPADDANLLGDFGGKTIEAHGVATTFSRLYAGPAVLTDGADGAQRVFPVAYAFGFHPLQQVLLDTGGGRLQAHTIAWDSRPREAGGQRWYDLYPDEDLSPAHPFHWTGDFQNWNFACAECHSTDVVRGWDDAKGTYATTWSEMNVACEACHGPGERHVAWARARGGRAVEEGEADADPRLDVRFPREFRDGKWTFSPGNPTAERVLPGVFRPEVETCARCHARRSPNRERYAFGRPLADSYDVSLLDPALYHADGQILDEVYEYGSFLQSKMYARGVSCRDCHDAHSGKVAYDDNRLCTRCHLDANYDTPSHHRHPQGSESARCVNCHMRPRTYMGVDARRDHGFRVPRPDLTAETGAPNACNDCHPRESPAWAADWQRKWYGEKSRIGTPHFGRAVAAARDGKAGAGRLLLEAATDRDLPPMARGSVVALLREFMGPDAHGAVGAAARDESPLVRLGAARTLDALPPDLRLQVGRGLLADDVRGVRIEAAAQLVDLSREGLAAEDAAAIDRGVEEYVEAQRGNLDRAEAHANLGVVAAARGDLGAAEASFRRALAMRPSFDRAAVNLADVLRRGDRDAEGERVLREALGRAVETADLHHALGLLLVRRRRHDEALEHLRKAAELRPSDGHAAYVFAVALHDTGGPEEAMGVLRAAHERRPADREILQALTSFALAADDVGAAIAWARKLAAESLGDPQPVRLVERLERADPR